MALSLSSRLAPVGGGEPLTAWRGDIRLPAFAAMLSILCRHTRKLMRIGGHNTAARRYGDIDHQPEGLGDADRRPCPPPQEAPPFC